VCSIYKYRKIIIPKYINKSKKKNKKWNDKHVTNFFLIKKTNNNQSKQSQKSIKKKEKKEKKRTLINLV
jgi:hypothetical protein